MRKVLITSLLLNAILVGIYVSLGWRSETDPPNATRYSQDTLGRFFGSGASRSKVPSTGPEARYGIPLRDPILLDAPPVVIAHQMRLAGYPPVVILATVSDALSRRSGLDAAVAQMGNAARRGGRSAPEVIAAEKLRDRVLEEALQLVPEARAGYEDDTVAKVTGTDKQTREKIKYGELTAESIAAVKDVERYFGKVSDEDYEAKVRSVLSPADADDYLMFNSQFARRLQANIRSIDIDEQTYREFYTRLRNVASPPAQGARPGGLTPEESAIYNEVLGGDRFLISAPQLSDNTVDSSMFRGAGEGGVNAFTTEDARLAVDVVNRLKSASSPAQRQTLARETYANFMAKLSSDEDRRLFSESRFGKLLQTHGTERKLQQ